MLFYKTVYLFASLQYMVRFTFLVTVKVLLLIANVFGSFFLFFLRCISVEIFLKVRACLQDLVYQVVLLVLC